MSAFQSTEWPPAPTHELVCRMVEDKFNLAEIAETFRIPESQVRALIQQREGEGNV